MKRSERQTLARQTVEIVERGSYQSPSGRTVSLRNEVSAAKSGTKLYTAADLSAVSELPRRGRPAALQVTNESTFAAVQRLHQTGLQNTGCLNFASAKNPGGGFLNGAEAQEEALARASALYDCLLCAPGHYEQNRAGESCLYHDLIIASPGVPFFRNDDGALLENPVLTTVITAAAPNAGAVNQHEPARVPEIEPVLLRRAELVLLAAVVHGIENLVLGAWGCGVFQNDPRVVAAAFAGLLQPGCKYSQCFERVVFAIFDSAGTGSNYNAFREEFSP